MTHYTLATLLTLGAASFADPAELRDLGGVALFAGAMFMQLRYFMAELRETRTGLREQSAQFRAAVADSTERHERALERLAATLNPSSR